MVRRFFLITLLMAGSAATAGDLLNNSLYFEPNIQKLHLLQKSRDHIDTLAFNETRKISAFRAALYSAIIPGAGQYYARSYWRAAFWATAELAAWTTYFIYDARGNAEDERMRQFGDQYWSERRYWSKLYYQAAELNINLPADIVIVDIDGVPLIDNFSQDIADKLRYLEEEEDLRLSHRLPATKTQQYYEMIYKYPAQFGNGWIDSDFFIIYATDGSNLPWSARKYRDMRNLSDEFFDIATGASMAALINHVLSALDAAWTARSYNRSLQMQVSIHNRDYFNERVRMYSLNIAW